MKIRVEALAEVRNLRKLIKTNLSQGQVTHVEVRVVIISRKLKTNI